MQNQRAVEEPVMALLLSRRVGESIIIDSPNGRIVVTVTDVHNGVTPRAVIGVEAPKDVPIDRLERHEQKQREQP